MRRWLYIVLLVIFLGLLGLAAYLYFRSGRGIGSPTNLSAAPAPTTIPLVNYTTMDGINLPPGFTITKFASGLNGPRMLAIDAEGQLHVTERGAGRVVRLPDRNRDGLADSVEEVASGLNAPSGLAFSPTGQLYVAEPGGVKIFSERNDLGVFTNTGVLIEGFPTGGHNTRTLLISPDGATLYVSIGSSCNVCNEDDARRGAVSAYNLDGSGERLFARGLRNAVGLTFRPGTDEIWATDNGRDMMGDELPPETINLVRDGDDFGWPRCHSGRIIDPEFGSPSACADVKPPEVEMQAHSAPLGLTFYTGDKFPADFRGDLFVAFHGSWNRTLPTGYKVVRIPMQGDRPGPVEDFAWGWIDGRWGRPVDLITGADGSLYVSDDLEGVIYRISYTASQP